MTDIVERLRQNIAWTVEMAARGEYRPYPLCAEAADEIERLRAELASRDEIVFKTEDGEVLATIEGEDATLLTEIALRQWFMKELGADDESAEIERLRAENAEWKQLGLDVGDLADKIRFLLENGYTYDEDEGYFVFPDGDVWHRD